MKIKEGYILRNVAGSFVVVPIGEATLEFNGMMNLNETGAFLFEKMIDGISRDDLIKALTDEYDVDDETAAEDVDAFIEKVKEQDLFEEE
ncbi:MAG: PqqD family protein [Eubacterium sp.]|nr:PqqD family protein [Eubacterium sp.]